MAEVIYANAPAYPSTFIARVIDVALGLVELLLGVRLVLEFFGANAGAGFVAWIYNASAPLVAPFAGAFPNFILGGVIDVSTILAMIVYSVLAWLLVRLISFIFSAL